MGNGDSALSPYPHPAPKSPGLFYFPLCSQAESKRILNNIIMAESWELMVDEKRVLSIEQGLSGMPNDLIPFNSIHRT